MGRNIVRQKNLPAVCSAISAIVHEDISVEKALEIAGLPS